MDDVQFFITLPKLCKQHDVKLHHARARLREAGIEKTAHLWEWTPDNPDLIKVREILAGMTHG